MIIAIDGPAGSGKSTIAKMLAEKLKFQYIDTGAMYRAVTFAFIDKLEQKNDFSLSEKLVNKEQHEKQIVNELLGTLKIELDGSKVFLNSEDISAQIRTPLVSANVAEVAAMAAVRENLVEQQRELGLRRDCVMDGRDIGTVVFPNAELKIFLTASAEVRARRRLKEFTAQGANIVFDDLVAEIKDRDRKDMEREVSPLMKADDAIEINSDDLSIEEVLEKISSLAA